MSQIKLQSSDGGVFAVDIEVAKVSRTIRAMLEDLGIDEDDVGDEIIPLPRINAFILAKVIDWATVHKDIVPTNEQLVSDDDDEDLSDFELNSWGMDFLEVDQGTLFQLVIAAHYLDIRGLYDFICSYVAKMIKGKNPEEIRKMFNIDNDFSPTERYLMSRENAWCQRF